jgi:hypothetical protein
MLVWLNLIMIVTLFLHVVPMNDLLSLWLQIELPKKTLLLITFYSGLKNKDTLFWFTIY